MSIDATQSQARWRTLIEAVADTGTTADGPPDEAVEAAAGRAFAAYRGELVADVSGRPDVREMRADLLAVAADILHAPAGYAGTVTTGSPESALLVALAARGARPDVERPQIVAPSTVHVDYHRAARALGMDLTLVDIDPDTMRALPLAIASAFTERTVLVVASAPSFPHGAVDPVEDIAEAAGDFDIRCHVDGGVAGWTLPLLDAQMPWTFDGAAVTSMSVDVPTAHLQPSGVGIVLHRSMALRDPQVQPTPPWPGPLVDAGGLMAPAPLGPLAAAWATVRLLGLPGYAVRARAARDRAVRLAAALDKTLGLRVLGAPSGSVLALAVDGSCDVFTVADEVRDLGWMAQVQPSWEGIEPSVRLDLADVGAERVDALGQALAHSVAAATAAGPARADPLVAGMLAALGPGSLDMDTLETLLTPAGIDLDGDRWILPGRLAGLRSLVAACPPDVRQALVLALARRT
ncbi:MAG: pyridoxal-dependent decarboxylase [Dermatophilaceae bacterium]